MELYEIACHATSGLPQGSVSWLAVLIMHRDIACMFNNITDKFAGDTKATPSVHDAETLHKVWKKFSVQSGKQNMPFSVDKWHIFQVETRKRMFSCEICNTKLKTILNVLRPLYDTFLNLEFTQQSVQKWYEWKECWVSFHFNMETKYCQLPKT